jgi:hypothetical protein
MVPGRTFSQDREVPRGGRPGIFRYSPLRCLVYYYF